MGEEQEPQNTAPDRREQLEVMAGMVLAVAIGGAIAWIMWDRIGITPRTVSINERLAYAAKWCLVPGACVMLGVGMIANHRFFTRAIDPLKQFEDRTLIIWQRYLSNTLEQTLLFVIGAAAFAGITYQYWLKAIPIVAVLFALGRLLFVVGYFVRPTLRATGFALTFYPMIVLYAVSFYAYWVG